MDSSAKHCEKKKVGRIINCGIRIQEQTNIHTYRQLKDERRRDDIQIGTCRWRLGTYDDPRGTLVLSFWKCANMFEDKYIPRKENCNGTDVNYAFKKKWRDLGWQEKGMILKNLKR